MNNFTKIILVLIPLLLFACKPDDSMDNPMMGGGTNEPDIDNPDMDNPDMDNPDVNNPSTDFVVETIIPSGDEQFLNENSDYIFNQDKLPTFEINLPVAELARIDADPAAEQYVEASLTFEGETVSPVGLRYKGSIGAFVGCVSGSDWANPSGYKTCTKLSMKIKLNWLDSSFKFYKLKKLQFHSQNNDDSQMHERLGYWLFRKMGVPAPRSIHARVLINGEYVGLFALTEQIDGRFTRYNYDDGEGNLYKEIWPLNSNGQAHSAATYRNNLKTNEDENPSVELIQSFAQEVAAADSEDLPNVIANRMDIDEIISYAAVDRTIRNDDGAFHWYCWGNDCNPHNFYWYEEPNEGKLHLIPWDLDHAFINIISNQNGVIYIPDEWGETRNNCQPFTSGWFGIQQRSAACDKLTSGWTTFEDLYEQKLIEFKNGPLSENEVNALLEKWTEQIREATMEASDLHDDAITINRWENELNAFRSQINYARNN